MKNLIMMLMITVVVLAVGIILKITTIIIQHVQREGVKMSPRF